MPEVDAVLFDLGGTLAEYFTREEFQHVLTEALAEVSACLVERGLPVPPEADVRARVEAEDHTAPDYRVRPLAGRLSRIFDLPPSAPPDLLDALCRRWLRPVFARGRLYDDALPALHRLRQAGIRTAIVSNTPWGSPAAPWREEVARLGLTPLVDQVLFCADVGWRKPAPPVFEEAMRRLRTPVQRCLFVGDDPRWDLAGPRALGMKAVLIDRSGGAEGAIRTLEEVLPFL